MSHIETVKSRALFQRHSAGGNEVEIWDDNYNDDGWNYFSIVAFSDGTAHKLDYVRVKDGSMQRRTYDETLDDLWIEAD